MQYDDDDHLHVQFNKILTGAGGTSFASETCQAGSQNLHLRNALILSIKDFVYDKRL
jgi:hypothetical protein